MRSQMRWPNVWISHVVLPLCWQGIYRWTCGCMFINIPIFSMFAVLSAHIFQHVHPYPCSLVWYPCSPVRPIQLLHRRTRALRVPRCDLDFWRNAWIWRDHALYRGTHAHLFFLKSTYLYCFLVSTLNLKKSPTGSFLVTLQVLSLTVDSFLSSGLPMFCSLLCIQSFLMRLVLSRLPGSLKPSPTSRFQPPAFRFLPAASQLRIPLRSGRYRSSSLHATGRCAHRRISTYIQAPDFIGRHRTPTLCPICEPEASVNTTLHQGWAPTLPYSFSQEIQKI